MAKHIALACSLYHSHRSKQLLRQLNRLGHCSSYETVRRHLTSLAESHIIEANNLDFILSTNIEPYIPGRLTQHVMNNLDFREETMYGATTHVISQIVVQKSHGKQRQLELASSKGSREGMLRNHVQEGESSSQKYKAPKTLFISSLTDHVRNEWYQPNARKIQCAVEKDLVWLICHFVSSSVEINDSVKYNIPN